jgi:phage shock protein C
VSSLVRPAGDGAPAGFCRDRDNAQVFGVCAGLANSLNVDPTIIRLVFFAGTILGFSSLILIYLAIALLAD